MPITTKRAYEEPGEDDGYRVLVDRLWPRGISKERLRLDEWLKEAAPSDALRSAYHSDEISWQEFRNRYLSQLKEQRDSLRDLARRAEEMKVTLVFSSKNTDKNNATVLKQYLKMLN